MINYHAMRIIESVDPDAGSKKPTAEDYAAHKAWAIATYGVATWEIYARGAYNDTRYEY